MPSKGKAGKLQTKSPAEFFADNKNIAGFDNPGKSLYTTIRELVENGLDACEQIGQLPTITVKVVEVSKEMFVSTQAILQVRVTYRSSLTDCVCLQNEEQGIAKRDRIDDTMYRDHETDKEKKAREAKENREATAAAKR